MGNFQIAFRPQIVKYYSGEEFDALRALVHNTAKYSYFLLFALACPVMFNAQFLLELWLGKVPEFASEFVVLNLIYLLLETLSAPMWMTIQATGKIRNYQIVISSVIFLNIIISYFFFEGRIFADSCDGNQVLSGFCLFGYTFAFYAGKDSVPHKGVCTQGTFADLTCNSIVRNSNRYLVISGFGWMEVSDCKCLDFYGVLYDFRFLYRNQQVRTGEGDGAA